MKESLSQCFTSGQWARANGRGIEDCPTYAMNALGEPYRASWRAGWADEDNKHSKPATAKGKR